MRYHTDVVSKSIKNRVIKKPRYKMVVAGLVDETLYNSVVNALAEYIENSEDYSGITLYITSLGGEVHIGLAIYDLFKSLKTSIYTVALGECTSAASIIFSLGKKRYVGKNSICLLHSVSIGNNGYQNKRDISEFISRMEIYNTKLQKIYKSIPNVTQEYINFIDDLFANTREFCLGAEDLLKFGMATDMLNNLNETY